MPADLLIRNATLPDGRTGIDLLAQGGLIAALAPALPAPPGAQVIDAAGAMLSPPFVDAHFHLDATLSHGLPRVNASGTLLEGIALWAHLLSQKLELDLGMLWINQPAAPSPEMPFGGVKDSGYGSEGRPEAMEAYLITKAVSIIGV